jgi:Na+/H+-dicarboxylate symporter
MPAKKHEVHRGLALATPAPKGRDVKVLQEQINHVFRHFRIDRRIAEDGQLGKQTMNAARQVALLLGVDRFMSEARAITNLIGNGVATLVVSRSEGAFDDAKREIADANL